MISRRGRRFLQRLNNFAYAPQVIGPLSVFRRLRFGRKPLSLAPASCPAAEVLVVLLLCRLPFVC